MRVFACARSLDLSVDLRSVTCHFHFASFCSFYSFSTPCEPKEGWDLYPAVWDSWLCNHRSKKSTETESGAKNDGGGGGGGQAVAAHGGGQASMQSSPLVWSGVDAAGQIIDFPNIVIFEA